MTSRARRITQFTAKEIDQLFKTAWRALRESGITILMTPRTGDIGRILIIIPKKVGTAPTRNLLRRRIKSIFYQERLYEQSYDCIVLFKKEAASLSFDVLKHLMLKAYAHTQTRLL